MAQPEPSARHRQPRRRRLAVAGAALALAALWAVPVTQGRALTNPGFTSTYVSTTLAGGEPFVIHSTKAGDLVYSSHEGTTHLFKDGLVQPSTACDPTVSPPSGFLCSYVNEVNVWTSGDGGKTWPQTTLPPTYQGFSDPSLTEDAGGNIYNTGIDLANDALFSSPDGGKTFPTGTPQCHNGDRPWLAGGKANEVFLATDTVDGPGNGHELFHSTDAGASCSSNGIPDNGPFGTSGGSYSGFGQIYYDHLDGTLIEPAVFNDSSGNLTGIGVSILGNASNAAFDGTDHFTPHQAASGTSLLAHWPAVAIDSANNLYVVWDTQPRDPNATTGCSTSTPNATGGPALLANSVLLSYSQDHGATWSAPITVAHPGTTVLWPWIAAGANGNVSVVWYQYNTLTDPDCDSAGLTSGTPSKLSVRNASFNAIAGGAITAVDAVGQPIHQGGTCQGGTTCVATGQDRRLGDYFTNALDQNGCVMIATGDTRMVDSVTGGQLATSRPLFIKQNSGTSLTTGADCAATTAVVPDARWTGLLIVSGVAVAAVVGERRRRRLARA